MDQLTKYPQLIQRILTEYIELCNRNPELSLETFLIVDESKAHYIWMNLGWQNDNRVTGITVYVRIRDGKFWIEEDWTEEGIATDLVRALSTSRRYCTGIPRAEDETIHRFCCHVIV